MQAGQVEIRLKYLKFGYGQTAVSKEGTLYILLAEAIFYTIYIRYICLWAD